MDPIRLVVDGAGYTYWYDEDPRDFSTSFSHRGGGSTTSVRIESDDGVKAAFYPPTTEFFLRGWWRRPARYGLMDGVCSRAIQIAMRNGSRDYWIEGDELAEVYVGPRVPLSDHLQAAAAALPAANYDLVVALLAIGCLAEDSDRDVLDDWGASHANEITASPLASWLDEPALGDVDAYKTRSAFQFLVELCAQVNIDLGLATKAWDEQLENRRPHLDRPWGIPVEHWWWKQGRLQRDGTYFYPDDD